MNEKIKNDMREAKTYEVKVMDRLKQSGNVETVSFASEGITEGKKIQAFERIYGDLKVLTTDGDVKFIEVKSDGSMERTGNLFLETLSDNGERSGRITVGWFSNKDHKYDTYCFYNKVNPKKSVWVPVKAIESYIDGIKDSLRTVKMTYDQQQYNRSEGLLIKHSKLVNDVDEADYIDLRT